MLFYILYFRNILDISPIKINQLNSLVIEPKPESTHSNTLDINTTEDQETTTYEFLYSSEGKNIFSENEETMSLLTNPEINNRQEEISYTEIEKVDQKLPINLISEVILLSKSADAQEQQSSSTVELSCNKMDDESNVNSTKVLPSNIKLAASTRENDIVELSSTEQLDLSSPDGNTKTFHIIEELEPEIKNGNRTSEDFKMEQDKEIVICENEMEKAESHGSQKQFDTSEDLPSIQEKEKVESKSEIPTNDRTEDLKDMNNVASISEIPTNDTDAIVKPCNEKEMQKDCYELVNTPLKQISVAEISSTSSLRKSASKANIKSEIQYQIRDTSEVLPSIQEKENVESKSEIPTNDSDTINVTCHEKKMQKDCNELVNTPLKQMSVAETSSTPTLRKSARKAKNLKLDEALMTPDKNLNREFFTPTEKVPTRIATPRSTRSKRVVEKLSSFERGFSEM